MILLVHYLSLRLRLEQFGSSYLAPLCLCKLPYVALNRHLRKMLPVRPLLKLTHAALWYFTSYDSPAQLPLERLLKNIEDKTESYKERCSI